MKIHFYLKPLVAVVLLVVSACAGIETKAECGLTHDLIFNELHCAAVRHMEAKDYPAAVRAFEVADDRGAFEVPRDGLLLELAWAYFKAGELEKAEVALAKAELTIAVNAGILRCLENNEKPYFYIAKVDKILDLAEGIARGEEDSLHTIQSPDRMRLKIEFIDDVEKRMCSALYHYDREFLDKVLWEANIVQEYFDVKQRIEEATGRKIKRMLPNKFPR